MTDNGIIMDFFKNGFSKFIPESNIRNHIHGGINYRRVLHPDWNVIKVGSGYQLRFSNRPILDFEISDGSESIKSIKKYQTNWLWLQNVSKDSIRAPEVNEMRDMALLPNGQK